MKKCELCGIEKKSFSPLCSSCEMRLEVSIHYYTLSEKDREKHDKNYILSQEDIKLFSPF